MNRKYTWRRKKKIGASHDRRLDRIVRCSVAFIGQIETRWRSQHDLPKSSVKDFFITKTQ
ncbi:hypothetical protein T4A_1030 [Trichinella pseudospiralis]|uniref:Uncharacterized protein n=2 Tax=Trichinella pseudospiralis TaxID=6337 RepID=A0A0V1DKB4_TRIPS|nr:hypothetical protein T4A_1030 [Trichinella pseudospiralis]